MNTPSYVIALALVAIPCAEAGPQVSTSANCTFKLVESDTAPNLRAKDRYGVQIKGGEMVYGNKYVKITSKKSVVTNEYGSKMVTRKISNKEILQGLVAARVIPEISGWSIVLLDDVTYAATKNGRSISLGKYIYGKNLALSLDNQVEQESSQRVTTTSGDIRKTVYSGKSYHKFPYALNINTRAWSLSVTGISNDSHSIKQLDDGISTFWQSIPGKKAINSLTGSFSNINLETNTIVEGSVSVSAAKVIETR